MPTYTVKYSNFTLSQKQKNSLAREISNTHSKFTGANTFFAQVIFQKNEKKSHFMGGKLVKTKEIFLNGQIRAGRTSKVKKQLILGLKKILIKNTNLRSDFVWVYLEDLLPDQMIEYGEVLPKSGQEKKWFNSLEKGEKILIIDDLIATGGTAEAAAKIVEISGGKVAGFIFVINLFDLPGNNLLRKKGYKTESLIEFPGH